MLRTLALRKLERAGVEAYFSPMDDTSHRRLPADRDPPMPSEPDLRAALERSEAQFAAGEIVSGDEVLRELDESVARMKVKRSSGVRRRAVARP